MPVHYDISNGTALVTLDNPPLNVFGQSMRQGLKDAIEQAHSDGAERIILTGAGRSFVAGADAKEFDGPPLTPHLNDIFAFISGSSIPCIAALNGVALGGGLELALSCRYRIATSKAAMGLPEVILGIIPGSGGTQRLPRVIGIANAVEMIGQGKSITGAQAKERGLVDMIAEDPVAAARDLDAAILECAIPTDQRPAPVEDLDAIKKAHALANKRAAGQDAPHIAIDLIALTSGHPIEYGLVEERQAFLKLRKSDQARALRHVFFAERAALSRGKAYPTTKERIETAIVVGGGTMGSAIAYALATVGIAVTVVEINDKARARADSNVNALVAKGIARGLLSDSKAKEISAKLTCVVGYDNLPDADLAIEAAFEDISVKKTILKQLQDALPDTAILATNTSYLDVNILAKEVRNPGRFIGLHFFAPAHIMKLLEIIKGDTTSDETIGVALRLARQLSKMPVLAGVCDGFIGNRILQRYRQAADVLLLEGATPESIDAAMRDFGMAMGPYETQDMSGLDIAYANRQRHDLRNRTDVRYVSIADTLVEDLKRLGRKTSAGWYDYDEGGKVSPSQAVTECLIAASKQAGIKRKTISNKNISDQLVLAMIAEGVDIIEEGIAANPSDIDLVMVHGYGFPRWRGGLMHYANSLPLLDMLSRIKTQTSLDPLSWQVPAMLKTLVDQDRTIDSLNP